MKLEGWLVRDHSGAAGESGWVGLEGQLGGRESYRASLWAMVTVLYGGTGGGAIDGSGRELRVAVE